MSVVHGWGRAGPRRIMICAVVAWALTWYVFNHQSINNCFLWLRATPSSTCADILGLGSISLDDCESGSYGNSLDAFNAKLSAQHQERFKVYFARSESKNALLIWIGVPVIAAATLAALNWILTGFKGDKAGQN